MQLNPEDEFYRDRACVVVYPATSASAAALLLLLLRLIPLVGATTSAVRVSGGRSVASSTGPVQPDRTPGHRSSINPSIAHRPGRWVGQGELRRPDVRIRSVGHMIDYDYCVFNLLNAPAVGTPATTRPAARCALAHFNLHLARRCPSSDAERPSASDRVG